jgi:hypothetical protein
MLMKKVDTGQNRLIGSKIFPTDLLFFSSRNFLWRKFNASQARCLIHKAHLHFWRNFLEFSIMKYIQFYAAIKKFLLLNAKPELQGQILNNNISQNFSLSVSSFDLKFCKNLGFSLSEHCEWGTSNSGSGNICHKRKRPSTDQTVIWQDVEFRELKNYLMRFQIAELKSRIERNMAVAQESKLKR